MKFYINKDGVLRGEAFKNCGKSLEELREEFRELPLVELYKMADQTNPWDELDEKDYLIEEIINERELTLVEMYKMADQTNTWDELDEEFYQEMANEAGLDFNSYSDLQDLMDDLEKAIK